VSVSINQQKGLIKVILLRQSKVKYGEKIVTRNEISTLRMRFQRVIREPMLTKYNLFQRDLYICMYCGNRHKPNNLVKDYVTPLAQGGLKQWSNVVTACRSCNLKKGRASVEQSQVRLLAIPYTPDISEYVILSERKVKVDQMKFIYRRSSEKLVSNQNEKQLMLENATA